MERLDWTTNKQTRGIQITQANKKIQLKNYLYHILLVWLGLPVSKWRKSSTLKMTKKDGEWIKYGKLFFCPCFIYLDLSYLIRERKVFFQFYSCELLLENNLFLTFAEFCWKCVTKVTESSMRKPNCTLAIFLHNQRPIKS